MNNSLPGQAECGVFCVCAQINRRIGSLLSNKTSDVKPFMSLIQFLLSSVGVLPRGKTENLHINFDFIQAHFWKKTADPPEYCEYHICEC